MAPSEILDAALVLTAIVWIRLAAVILIDRALYDRWARRIAMLRGQLIHASDTALERLAAGVTVDEFYQLVLAGVPSNVETALGRAGLTRGRHPAILQLALGASRAHVWKRIRAAQILASARTDDVYHPLDKMLRSGDGVLAAAALRLLVRHDEGPSAEMTVQALRDGVHFALTHCRRVQRDVGGPRRHSRPSVYLRGPVLPILGRTPRVLPPGTPMGPPGARTEA